MKRVHIIFDSKYMDINHRFLIKQKAMSLGLMGYCRVNRNKQMEIEVEGKNRSIEEFLRFIENGILDPLETGIFTIEMFDQIKGYMHMETDIL